MQKVVIDTNVVISSFISSKGVPAKIIALITLNEKYVIYYNADILAEYRDVLTRAKFDKYNFKAADIANFIKKVRESGILIEPLQAIYRCRTRATECFTTRRNSLTLC